MTANRLGRRRYRREADLIVIGGGLQGCATALFAVRRGLSVIVLEKDSVGRHASGVNAGGVRRLGRDPAEIGLSDRAMALWRIIAEIVDDDCGFKTLPHVKVAETDAELETLVERAATLRGMGYEHEQVVGRSALRRLLPAVADHCVGGLTSLDGYAIPWTTTAAFRRKAEAEGVLFREGTAVSSVASDGAAWCVTAGGAIFRAARILNCAGAWGGQIAAMVGDHIPIKAIAPMMIVTQRLPPFCDAVVGTVGQPLSFKQMPNGTVLIGGARLGHADAEAGSADLRFDELRRSAKTAIAVFPIMRGATIQRCWSGIEGRTPDRLPVIGRSPRSEGVFHAFGFSAHGFQLGPAVGEIMTELIANGSTQTSIHAFEPARFECVANGPGDH